MRFNYLPPRLQAGMVLILTLLLLFTVTLLATSLFEAALLQNKAVSNFSNRSLALIQAESGLSLAERMLANKPVLGSVIGNGWRYSCSESKHQCITTAQGCYQINVIGQAGRAKVALQAIYQITQNHLQADIIETKLTRRSWIENTAID